MFFFLMPSLCLHGHITMQSLWSIVVCMRIDTVKTCANSYGSIAVEQSPFLVVDNCKIAHGSMCTGTSSDGSSAGAHSCYF